ncbi:MFS transporter [Streptomyces sp. NPDC001604]|uniref:MFS transporter n=1 Tax=Streptomyces sp. NPDC001604 TaxID=3364593 RepID=UPI0036985269
MSTAGQKAPAPSAPDATTRLDKRGRRAFTGAVGGWAMDGFDVSIFALIAAPAFKELLPAAGQSPSEINVGFYTQLSAAFFLTGWGLSFIWGPVADRFGRRPAMIGSILTFSVFTALAGAANSPWWLMACRFFAALGVGGEWAIAGTVVAEAVPERLRSRMGGYMHSATYVGSLLVSLVYLAVGNSLGWRGLLFLGLLPALLVLFLRLGMQEPERFEAAQQSTATAPGAKSGFLAPLRTVLQPPYRARSWGNLVLLVVSVMGLWAGSTFGPTAMVHMAEAAGRDDEARLASLVSLVSTACTIIGCWAVPHLTDRFGRRRTLAALYGLMAVGILGAYGLAYPREDIPLFFVFAVVLGFGGANFAVFTVWLPEQYPTQIRATAFAFATTLSRLAAAVGTLLIAWGISATGSLSLPLALTAVPFIAGIFLVRLVPETQGQSLPE